MRRRRVSLAGLLVALFCTSARAQQVPTFTPFHANGIYESGEKVGWTVTRPADAAGPTRFAYDIKKNEFDVLKSGMLDLSLGTATIEIVVNEPSMVYVQVTPEAEQPPPADAAQTKPYASVGAAVAPDRLQPSLPRPADFDDFWAAKLKAQRELPMNPVLTPAASEVPGVDVSAVRLDSLGSHMQGYVAKPQRAGRFPALVIYQGAGVRALKPATGATRAAEGWLVLDVDAHDKAPDAPTGPPNNYQTIGNTDREQSYFLNMYLRDSRAIDYIATRSDWDGKTLVILGTSQGGQQGLVTAGLNPDRITALLVNEPSGGDTNGELHGRRAAYPNWPSNDPKAMQAALYFDTVNFASRIKAPTLASMGFIDRVVPPAGVWIALNQIPAAREALPMIEANHVHLTPDKVGAFAVRSTEVLGLLLGGAEYKPIPLSLASVSALAPASARAQTPSAPPVAAAPPVPAPPAARSPADPEAAAARAAAVARDWPALAFYRADNEALPAPAKDHPRVVFMGDSITQAWVRQRASFFTDNGYVGRGISGQTSPQMLLRFHQDVVALKPAAVLILAGTNDVAENTGPMTDEQIIDNLMAMVEIAQANTIKVVIGSVTPATSFFWRRDAVPAPRIAALNVKLKAWAAARHLTYADFWAAMSMPDGTMNPANANDTVHPNAVGYGIMEPIAQAAIAKALTSKD